MTENHTENDKKRKIYEIIKKIAFYHHLPQKLAMITAIILFIIFLIDTGIQLIIPSLDGKIPCLYGEIIFAGLSVVLIFIIWGFTWFFISGYVLGSELEKVRRLKRKEGFLKIFEALEDDDRACQTLYRVYGVTSVNTLFS